MATDAFSNPAQILGSTTDTESGTETGTPKQSQIYHEAVPETVSLSSNRTEIIKGGRHRRHRLRDVDEFPIGVWVKTPTGRLGVVVAHKGAESRDDRHERCTIRYHCGGGEDRDTVTLLPHLLKPASEGPQMELF